jgi:uncharacterized membrane protein SirB2
VTLDYLAIKTVHVTAVALSIAGFCARGAGSLRAAGWVRSRAARTLPHVVDTVLLASALTLAWMLRQAPGQAGWLTAKVIGLLVYIAFGMLALKPGRPRAVRAAAFAAALATFGYIVSVALTKSPAGFLRWLA